MILRVDPPEFEVLGDTRTLQIGVERFDVFEFRGELTRYRPALTLTDGWDAATVEEFPDDWRQMDDATLLNLFRRQRPDELHAALNRV